MDSYLSTLLLLFAPHLPSLTPTDPAADLSPPVDRSYQRPTFLHTCRRSYQRSPLLHFSRRPYQIFTFLHLYLQNLPKLHFSYTSRRSIQDPFLFRCHRSHQSFTSFSICRRSYQESTFLHFCQQFLLEIYIFTSAIPIRDSYFSTSVADSTADPIKDHRFCISLADPIRYLLFCISIYRTYPSPTFPRPAADHIKDPFLFSLSQIPSKLHILLYLSQIVSRIYTSAFLPAVFIRDLHFYIKVSSSYPRFIFLHICRRS